MKGCLFMNLYEQLKRLGIRIGIQMINGTGDHHYYDHINDVIVIDVNAEEPDIVSIVHEYIHYLQWHNGYRKLMVWEIDNIPYSYIVILLYDVYSVHI